MSRQLLRGALGALVTLAVLLVAALLALRTDAVRDAVLARVLAAAGAEVERVEGTLAGPLVLHGLRTEDDRVRVDRLRLDWSPATLFGATVLVRELEADDVRIALGAPQEGSGAPFTGLRLPVAVRVRELQLRRLSVAGVESLAGASLDASARLRGAGRRVDVLDLDLHLRAPEARSARIAGEASVQLSADLPFSLDLGVDLGIPETAASLTLTGRGNRSGASLQAELLTPRALQVDLELTDFDRLAYRARVQLTAPERLGEVQVLDGALRVEGEARDARFDLRADTIVPDPLGGEPLRLSLDGSGALDDTDLRYTLRGLGPEFSVEVDGRTALAGGATTAQLGLDVASAARWLPDRDLAFGARTAVRTATGEDGGVRSPLALHFDDLLLEGTLDGRPLRIEGTLTATGGAAPGLEDVDLRARLGDNDASLTGRFGPELAGEAVIDVADLAELDPGLGGQGRIEARVAGTPTAPAIDVDLRLDALRVADLRVGRVDGRGRLSEGAERQLALTLEATDLEHAALPKPASVTLNAEGTLADLPVSLSVAVGPEHLQTTGHLDLSGAPDAAQGVVRTLLLDSTRAGRWTLTEPVAVDLRRDPDEATIARGCLASGTARLCVDPVRLSSAAGPGTNALSASLTGFDLERLASGLPPTLAVTGRLAASARLEDSVARLALRPEDVRLSLLDPDTAEVLFADALEAAALDLERGPAGVTASARVRATGAGAISVDATLGAAPELAEAPLDLTATFALDELALFTPFLTGVEGPEGRLHGTLRLAGTPGDPRFDGEIEAGFSAFVPALGRSLELAEFHARGSGGDVLAFEGRLDFDDRPLRLSGEVDYATTTGLVGNLAISGREVPVVALPDLALWLSPELRADLGDGTVTVDGTLGLPRARIAVTSVPASGPTRSPDVVVHRPERDAPERALRTQARLDLVLGDDVELIAGSLRTRLVGDLEVVLDLDRAVTARGRIETRGGSVTRFGRELAIARGALAFDGPLLAPDVAVTASRRVDDREVGVSITGPPDALETTLFSDPPTDDTTALTMLVTGRAPDATRPEDADRVAAAAFGLGVGAANPFLQDVGERFGLEEFGIDTSTGAVVAGTRLSDRLYARYNYGLATRASGLQIEYRISERLSARTESGPVHALDLLYRREFD